MSWTSRESEATVRPSMESSLSKDMEGEEISPLYPCRVVHHSRRKSSRFFWATLWVISLGIVAISSWAIARREHVVPRVHGE